MDEQRLGRWERYYLASARHGRYVSVPKHSKVIDSLHAKGLIEGFGFVIGRYAEHNLTPVGVEVADELRAFVEAQR